MWFSLSLTLSFSFVDATAIGDERICNKSFLTIWYLETRLNFMPPFCGFIFQFFIGISRMRREPLWEALADLLFGCYIRS